MRRSLPKPKKRGRRCIEGTVLWVDHFGNLITNIHSQAIEGWDGVWADVAGQRCDPISHFSAADAGTLALLAGSAGVLEVVEVMGSATTRLGIGAGALVSVRGLQPP